MTVYEVLEGFKKANVSLVIVCDGEKSDSWYCSFGPLDFILDEMPLKNAEKEIKTFHLIIKNGKKELTIFI